MKESLFNVSEKYKDDQYWVYNTLTTSIVILEEKEYNRYFIDKEYDVRDNTFKELVSLGLFVGDDDDELEYLKDLRAEVASSDSPIADLIIATTMECDARCYYCFEHGCHNEKMSKSTALAVVDYIDKNWNHELFNISWFGGEPLLATDVMDFISEQLELRKIRFISKITTNGYNLTKENIYKAITVWHTNKIQVSIDAYGEEYNKIKKYIYDDDNPFGTVIENIGNALSAGLKIRARINFNPIKKETAKKIMSFLHENYKDEPLFSAYFAPIDAKSSVVPGIAGMFDKEIVHPYIDMIKFAQKFGYYMGNDRGEKENYLFDKSGLLAQLKLYPSPTNCYASCPSVFAIDSKGDIYKCHRVLGKGEKYSSGNIKEGIKKNSIYNFFCNVDVAFDKCNTCKVLPVCQGGCKINAYLYDDEHACIPLKSCVKDVIRIYLDKMIDG